MKQDNCHIQTHISIGKARAESVEISHNRLFVIMIVFALSFMVICLRVVDVAVISGGESVAVSDLENEVAPENVARRSDIVDRNGVILATSLATASLYANPKVMLDKTEAAQQLASVFKELDKKDLNQKFASEKSFVWIKRNLTPVEQYKVNQLGIPGVYFQEEQKRIYPHNNLAAHVLGFTNVDGKGLAGIEKKFNDYLVRDTSQYEETNDAPLTLSLDVRVQNIVRQALLDSVETFNAKGASGIVIDVNTGEVLAMVSLPDFDPNKPSEAAADALFNRATYGVYEMGSTFKTFNMAMGFENGRMKMNDSYDVSEPIRIGGFSIRDYHPKNGSMSVPEIFMESSNIGSAKIAMSVQDGIQKQFLGKLGMLGELPIEIPEKGMPLTPSTWSKISTMTVSYGHGIAVTPMHIASATAAMVNGGILFPATLLKKDSADLYGERVISAKTSNNMRKLLRLVVQHGTGGKAEVANYMVGGKTGSADKAATGGYNRNAIISSFVGAFPMNKPKYAVFVMVDEPIGNKSTGGFATGGMVAAPVVNKIISRIGPILGVMPVDENQYEIKKEFWYNGATPTPQLVSAETY